jgi:hypothetical protein
VAVGHAHQDLIPLLAAAERRKSFFTRVAEMAARGAVDVPPDPSLYVADQADALLALIRHRSRQAAAPVGRGAGQLSQAGLRHRRGITGRSG